MKWKRGPVSGDIEDRRGMRMSRVGGGLGLGGGLVVLVLSLIFGQDLTGIIGGGSETAVQTDSGQVSETPEEREEDRAEERARQAVAERDEPPPVPAAPTPARRPEAEPG